MTDPVLRAWIVGYGRMGRSVEDAWRARGHGVALRLRHGDAWPDAADADVAFEFTGGRSAEDNLRRLLGLGVPTVCGTTGWDPGRVREEADRLGIPLLVAPNFAVGVAALQAAAAEVSRRLVRFPEYEPAIVERHHAAKRDAPSGTAAMLAEVVASIRGERPPIASVRHGEQPGEHRLVFEGPGEELTLVHRARSRRPFAEGAVRAGEWLARSRPPGAASMEDFLASLDGGFGGTRPERSGRDA